ncbi:hypothetical protein [Geoglobus acetivorans]
MKRKIMLRLGGLSYACRYLCIIAKVRGYGTLKAFASGTAAFIACYVMLMPKPVKEASGQYRKDSIFSKPGIVEIILFVGLISMLLGLIV